MIQRRRLPIVQRRAALLVAAFLLAISSADSLIAQTSEEQAKIDWTLQRGRLLFGLDRAAWVGTDDMRANIADPIGAGLRGYIVEPMGDGFHVIFFAGDGRDLVQAYRGRVASGGVISREVFAVGERPPLTAAQSRMVLAVEVAGRESRASCSTSPFNPIVIPPATPEGPIDVYFLTPQTDDGIPFGGHHRVTVTEDGRIASERAFTNGCLTMAPPDSEVAGIGVSHLLDPIPTEIHVFSSMAIERPVFVATDEGVRVWEVTGQQIRLVDDSR